LKLLSESATAKLQAFRDATTAHVPGCPLLVSAKDLSGHISDVDPKYPSTVSRQFALLPALAKSASPAKMKRIN
jgi:hypothetical protein